MKTSSDSLIKSFDINEVLERLFQFSEYDFSQYSKSFIERRIIRIMTKFRLKTGYELIARLADEPKFCMDVLLEFSILVTEAFRDPDMFAAIREKVMPILSTYPFIRIWHAGCASGEEAYSIAIILHEMGLLERSKLYATDFNAKVILHAEQGMFSHKQLELYSSNYQKARGKSNFLEYVTQQKNKFYFKKFLKKNIVFLHHNLLKDDVLDGINFIICRNVFIYFNPDLQTRVLQLFNRSLVPRGFLCLGKQENINLIDSQKIYEPFTDNYPIYRKLLSKYDNV